MEGMDARTGRVLRGEEYLRQCIGIIATTPRGTCALNRGFGCGLPERVDRLAAETTVLAQADLAEAMELWETRARFVGVAFAKPAEGVLDIVLTVAASGTERQLTVRAGRGWSAGFDAGFG